MNNPMHIDPWSDDYDDQDYLNEDEIYQDQDEGGTGHGDISWSDADTGL